MIICTEPQKEAGGEGMDFLRIVPAVHVSWRVSATPGAAAFLSLAICSVVSTQGIIEKQFGMDLSHIKVLRKTARKHGGGGISYFSG